MDERYVTYDETAPLIFIYLKTSSSNFTPIGFVIIFLAAPLLKLHHDLGALPSESLMAELDSSAVGGQNDIDRAHFVHGKLDLRGNQKASQAPARMEGLVGHEGSVPQKREEQGEELLAFQRAAPSGKQVRQRGLADRPARVGEDSEDLSRQKR